MDETIRREILDATRPGALGTFRLYLDQYLSDCRNILCDESVPSEAKLVIIRAALTYQVYDAFVVGLASTNLREDQVQELFDSQGESLRESRAFLDAVAAVSPALSPPQLVALSNALGAAGCIDALLSIRESLTPASFELKLGVAIHHARSTKSISRVFESDLLPHVLRVAAAGKLADLGECFYLHDQAARLPQGKLANKVDILLSVSIASAGRNGRATELANMLVNDLGDRELVEARFEVAIEVATCKGDLPELVAAFDVLPDGPTKTTVRITIPLALHAACESGSLDPRVLPSLARAVVIGVGLDTNHAFMLEGLRQKHGLHIDRFARPIARSVDVGGVMTTTGSRTRMGV
ncbi:hypothetical protein HZC07_02995 [Candidatus Micrarchaeota archaeon]|nr:hypothetical protein [Candidatus Micrarchaeota archaeon]